MKQSICLLILFAFLLIILFQCTDAGMPDDESSPTPTPTATSPYYEFSVITDSATNITDVSVTLSGTLTLIKTNPGGAMNDDHFSILYWETANPGTQKSATTSGFFYGGTYSFTITGLKPTTKYSYQAVSYGQSGAILNFTTLTFAPARTFETQRVTDYTWYNVPSTLMAIGIHCLIYVENTQLAKVNTTTAQNIASEFDNNIYALIQNKFYTASDVDANGKIIILFLDIVDGYSGSGGYVAGYFSGLHCLDTDHSNRTDMLFMDTNPAIPGDSTSKFTIAHEFQHLVNFNKTYLEGGGSQEDVWINEGLSSAAEYLYKGSHITDKIDYYNNDPLGDLRNGIYFVTWAPSYANTAYTSYATVYLFFQWLRIQATNGDGIYKDILSSSYYDYRAVEAAANTRLYTGSWKEFYRDWLIANAFHNPTGKYGYKSELNTTPPLEDYSSTGGSFYLFPGEAVYAYDKIPPFSVTPTTYANYAGLDLTNKIVDTGSPFSTSNCILAYNSDGSTAENLVTVTLPVNATQFALAPYLQFKGDLNTTLPNSYPIDVQWPVGENTSHNRVQNEQTAKKLKPDANPIKILKKK